MTYFEGDGEHEEKLEWLVVRLELKAYDHLRSAYEAEPLVFATRRVPFYEAVARAKVMHHVLHHYTEDTDESYWTDYFFPLEDVEYDEYLRNPDLFRLCYNRFAKETPIAYDASKNETAFDRFVLGVQGYVSYHEGLTVRSELDRLGFRRGRPIEHSMDDMVLSAFKEEQKQ